MPKQIYKIDQFHGGLNTQANPSDIDDNQLVTLEDAMVDELGKIKMMGGIDTGVNTADNDGIAGTMKEGYGIHSWKSDYLGAEDKARQQAVKLTQQKFGNEKFRGASIFASKEENEFFKEQLKILKEQNIERELLREKEFTANEEKTNALVQEAQKNAEINKLLDNKNNKLDETVDKTKGIKECMR